MPLIRVLWLVGLLAAVPPGLLAQPASPGAACQSGFADGFTCNEMTLAANLKRPALGSPSSVNDIWGWTDPDTGREYALVGLNTGVAAVDVTDPDEPLYLAHLPRHSSTASLWRDIKTYGHYAFVVADASGQHGMQVFDLTQLRKVISPPGEIPAAAWYDGIGSAHNIAINEETGFAYALGSSGGNGLCSLGMHIIDIRRPLEPVYAGCFRSSIGRGYTHDAQCVVYHGPDPDYQNREICVGADEQGIAISDVTDKSAPREIATITYPQVGYAHQGWFTDDQRYFFSDDETDEILFGLHTRTLVWDLANLDDPILAHDYRASTTSADHNLYIVGDYVYQANYESGFRLLDIRDPLGPVEIGFLNTAASDGQGAWSVYPFFKSGTIVVSDIDNGLFVLQPQMNLRPAIRSDRVTIPANAQSRLRVQANDLDPNGDPLTLSIGIPPTNGLATVNADGTISYRPNRNYLGSDTFTYRAQDTAGETGEATVFVTVTGTDAATARVQFIHNSADPQANRLDVYLSGTLIADDLAYQEGTPFLALPGGTHEVSLAPGTSSNPADAFATLPISLAETASYVMIIQGVTNPAAFEANPDGLPIGLAIAVREDARVQAADPGTVDLFTALGVTDAGPVTVRLHENDGSEIDLATGLPYGEVAPYVPLAPTAYTFRLDTGALTRLFRFDFGDHAGEVFTLLASGFVDAGQQGAGPLVELVAVTADGTLLDGVVVGTDDVEVPREFAVSDAYPNPFNPHTTLELTLPAAEDVHVAAFDLLGRRVALLHEGVLPAGTHRLVFEAAHLPSGTYVIRAERGTARQHRLVTLVK